MRGLHVSILVLVDVPLEVYNRVEENTLYLFQSLFSWMFRSKLSIQDTVVPGYVSILVLVDVPLEDNPDPHFSGRYIVSILVLVDVPLEGCQVDGCQHPIYCFNPCSRGCSARSQSYWRP